ncbi:MAG: hypothetical protein WBI07_18355 [Mobilitalea sp.]
MDKIKNLNKEPRKELKTIGVPVFALEVVLFWMVWFLYGYAWRNSSDMIANVLRIVLVLVMAIIMVSAFLVVIRLKRNFSAGSSLTAMKKIISVIAFIIIAVVHAFTYYSFSDMGYSTSGLFSIMNKQEIGDSYYFDIKSTDQSHTVEIECTEEVYRELIIDEGIAYSFSYRWLTYDNDKGVLEGNIDTTDIIDNR